MLQVALEVQVPVSPTADDHLEVPPALMYACPLCPYEASSIANLRRHQTTAHQRTQFRSSMGHAMSCAVNGLPQCTFCFQTFTTWRQFQNHLDRQCCQVRPCDLGTDLDALLREEEEQRILRLHQSLTANLITKPYGQELLAIVQRRDWTALLDQRQACEDLAHQCCVCDFHFNRPQDLHSHLRVHHPKWIPHTFTKGSQLCRGFASNSPCRYCHKSFRQAHSCPILTQIGMLVIHLPSEEDQQDDPPAAALQCEICGHQADTSEEIHGHLATVHRLAFHDWQPERDMMGQDPACNHCATPFASVSAVRQHVTLGQCREFDPHRSPHLLPISTEMTQLMESGNFQPLLQDPMKRMRMTLHCAQCGVTYSRSNDLMLHLQTAHSTMWNKAQAMTRFLVKVLAPIFACVCNPCVHRFTLTHVCPLYRQIAMLSTRSAVELFLPWESDRGSLIQLMQRCHNHAACIPVIDAIHARQLTVLLQDQVMLEFLRSFCVLCGGAFHPALLRDHLIQVHASSLTRLYDILPFMYDTFMKVAHTDYQCAQCTQIFNLPLLGDPPLAEKHARQTLVLAHFQQCPVVHQIGHLLLHGYDGSSTTAGQRGSGAPDDVRGHGTAAHAAAPKAKRRRKGHQEGQNATSATGGRDEAGPSTGGPTHGQATSSTGCGAESTEKTRLLRLLHANGAGLSDSHLERQGQELASRDVSGQPDEDAGMEAAAGGVDTDPCGDNATATPEAVRLSTPGSTLPDGTAAQAPECQGRVLLPALGPGQAAADPDRSASSGHGPHETVHRPAGGEHTGPQQCPEIPLAEGSGDTGSHALDPPDLLALRRTSITAGNPVWEQDMEFAGSGTEAAHSQPKLTGAAAEEHAGEGQGDWQGQSTQEVVPLTGMEAELDRDQVRSAMRQMVLHNDQNHCYINSAVAATLWTFLSRADFHTSFLGPQATLIVDSLLHCGDSPITLATLPWFQRVMQHWPHQHSQGDPVEFISHVLRGLGLTGFDMKWERRVQIQDATRIVDQSAADRPLTVQFDLTDIENTSYGPTTLQTLLDHWASQYGMQSALTSPTTLLCIHVDRFICQGSEAAVKCERPIQFSDVVNIPIFVGNGIQTESRGFQLLAAIAHSGTDEAGHCRALLKTWPTDQPDPVSFLLVDDDCPPRRLREEPDWFQHDVNCFWLCDSAHIDLFRLPAAVTHVPAPPQMPQNTDAALTTDVEQATMMRLIASMPTPEQ